MLTDKNNGSSTTQGGGGATAALNDSAKNTNAIVQSQLRLSARNYAQASGWKEYVPPASLRSSFLPGLNLLCDCSCCGEHNIHIATDLAQEFDVVKFILQGDFKCPVPECNNALTFKDLVFKAPPDTGLNFSVHGRFKEQKKEDLTTLKPEDAKLATCPKETCYVMMSSAQEQEEESRRDQGIRGEENVGDSVEWVELFISGDYLPILDFKASEDCRREGEKEPSWEVLADNVFSVTLNDGSGATFAVKKNPNIRLSNRELINFRRLSHHHPDISNIIKPIAYYVTQGRWYPVFPCFEPIHDRSTPLRRNVAPHLATKVCDIDEIIKLVSTVADLHSKGYVHSDIKPENLVWSEKNGFIVINLTSMRKIGSGGISCTYPFSPPERIKTWLYEAAQRSYQNKPQTPIVEEFAVESDIYSLGITILVLLCGKIYPFPDDVKRDVGVPNEVRLEFLSRVKDQKMRAILHDMVQDDPSDRPPLKTVLEQLEALKKEQSQADARNQNAQGTAENNNDQTRSGVAGGGAMAGVAQIQEEESNLEEEESAATYSISDHKNGHSSSAAHASARVLLHCWANRIPGSVGPSLDTMLKLINAKFEGKNQIPHEMLTFFGGPLYRHMKEQYPEFQALLHKTRVKEKNLFDYPYFPPINIFALDVREVTQEALLDYCEPYGLLILRFGLTEIRWNKWNTFFEENPHGILTAQNLELTEQEAEDKEAITGYAAVIDLRKSTKEYLVLINSLGDKFANQGTCRIKDLDAINGCEDRYKNPTYVMGCKPESDNTRILHPILYQRIMSRPTSNSVLLSQITGVKAVQCQHPLEFCITPNSRSTNRLQQEIYYKALFHDVAVAFKQVALYDFVKAADKVPDEPGAPQTYHLEPVINHEIRAITKFQTKFPPHKHVLSFFGFIQTGEKRRILRSDEPSQYDNNILLLCERPQHTLESWFIEQEQKIADLSKKLEEAKIQSKDDTKFQTAILELNALRNRESLRILSALFQVVAFLAEKNIQHRNINPSSILLVDGIWKLADFSKAVDDDDLDSRDEKDDDEMVPHREQPVACGGGGGGAAAEPYDSDLSSTPDKDHQERKALRDQEQEDRESWIEPNVVKGQPIGKNQHQHIDVYSLGKLIKSRFFSVPKGQDMDGQAGLTGLAERCLLPLQAEGAQLRPSANEALEQFKALQGRL